MKVEIEQTEYYTNITLIPESTEEVSILLELTMNRLHINPDVRTFLKKDSSIECKIFFKNKSAKNQEFSIK